MRVRLTATLPDPSRMRLEATTSRGHLLSFDPSGLEGDDSAPSPTDAVLGALAACTAMDVASILRKKRQRPTRYTLEVQAEKSDEHPRIFTRVVIEHRVEGLVTAEALRRSIELSATRYCPVNAMLAGRVEVEHRYRRAGGEEPEAREVVVVTGPRHATPTA